jgi:predicted metalloprotease
MVTQSHTIPASNPEPSASSSIGPAVGGAVGGLIAVIIIIAVVVIALLVIKRGQKGSLKVNDRKESVQGYNNALYDGKQNSRSDE